MQSPKTVLTDLPRELLLGIIKQFDFDDGSIVPLLSQVHPIFRQLLQSNERSLTRWFGEKELINAPSDFPSPHRGFDWLARCVRQYDVLDDVMGMLISKENARPVAHFNMGLVNIGLLLLYRIQSLDCHAEKLTRLTSLPKDPLVAIYLAITHATLTARYHASGWIHQKTYSPMMDASMLSIREDLEFAFAEAAMQLGPSYIRDTLLSTPGAETALLNCYHNHVEHDWIDPSVFEGVRGGVPPIVQGPKIETKEASLWTGLLERLAELLDTPVRGVRDEIEDEIEWGDHKLAWLGGDARKALIAGRDYVVPLL